MAVSGSGRMSTPVVSAGLIDASSGSGSGHALDSAFVKGTSGDAFMVRYVCRTTDPIDALWVFIHAFTGTVTGVECDIYNENTAGVPGSTLRDSATAVAIPGADTQWMKLTFGTPYTPTVGEVLFFCVHNTTGTPASNFPTIRTVTTHSLGTTSSTNYRMRGYTTTNGATTSTLVGEAPCMVQQGSNYYGQPFTAHTASLIAADTNEKGIQFTVPTGLIWALYGYETVATSTNLNTAKLYADATAPGGSALQTWDLDSDANEVTNETIGAKIFDTPYLCPAGTYKFVFDPGGSVALTGTQIEDFESYATEFGTLFDGWAACKAVVENGGAWTVDARGCPHIRLLMEVLPGSGGRQGLHAIEAGAA